MKRKIIITLSFLCISLFSVVKAQTKQDSLGQKKETINLKNRRDSIFGLRRKSMQDILKKDSAIVLTLKMEGDPLVRTAGDLKISVTFKNKSNKTVRFVDQFADPLNCFTVLIKLADGATIKPSKKSQPAKSIPTYNYIELPAATSIKQIIDLSQLIRNSGNKDLSQGKYQLLVTYHNAVGENCIKGTLQSRYKKFEVTE